MTISFYFFIVFSYTGTTWTPHPMTHAYRTITECEVALNALKQNPPKVRTELMPKLKCKEFPVDDWT
jgi:hypothetical protein